MKKKNMAALVLGCLSGAYAIYDIIDSVIIAINREYSFGVFAINYLWYTLPILLIALYAILVGLGVMKKSGLLPGFAFLVWLVYAIYRLTKSFGFSFDSDPKYIVYCIMRILRNLLFIPAFIVGTVKGFKASSSFVAAMVLYCIAQFFDLIGLAVYGGVGLMKIIEVVAGILCFVALNISNKKAKEIAE